MGLYRVRCFCLPYTEQILCLMFCFVFVVVQVMFIHVQSVKIHSYKTFLVFFRSVFYLTL